MASKRLFVSTLLVILMLGLASSSSQAYKFIVGGKDGWVLSPSENFNHWAERHRFQVNDTLRKHLSLSLVLFLFLFLILLF